MAGMAITAGLATIGDDIKTACAQIVRNGIDESFQLFVGFGQFHRALSYQRLKMSCAVSQPCLRLAQSRLGFQTFGDIRHGFENRYRLPLTVAVQHLSDEHRNALPVAFYVRKHANPVVGSVKFFGDLLERL